MAELALLGSVLLGIGTAMVYPTLLAAIGERRRRERADEPLVTQLGRGVEFGGVPLAVAHAERVHGEALRTGDGDDDGGVHATGKKDDGVFHGRDSGVGIRDSEVEIRYDGRAGS